MGKSSCLHEHVTCKVTQGPCSVGLPCGLVLHCHHLGMLNNCLQAPPLYFYFHWTPQITESGEARLRCSNTNTPSSHWLNTTKAYFLLMFPVQGQSEWCSAHLVAQGPSLKEAHFGLGFHNLHKEREQGEWSVFKASTQKWLLFTLFCPGQSLWPYLTFIGWEVHSFPVPGRQRAGTVGEHSQQGHNSGLPIDSCCLQATLEYISRFHISPKTNPHQIT